MTVNNSHYIDNYILGAMKSECTYEGYPLSYSSQSFLV